MGGGNWSTNTYAASTTLRAAKGISAFDYSDTKRVEPRTSWKAHPDLDPKGVVVRESRDNDEHPNSTAITILFDETGSMHQIPVRLQEQLPDLFAALLLNGYIEDPQILMGAVGDAFADQVPLQVGQFESDNRIDEDLGKIFLEGNGGGNGGESYDLAMYFMARHTAMDCLEKRGKKGYFFLVADEPYFKEVNAAAVKDLIGDDLGGENISIENIAKELTDKFNVYVLIAGNCGYGDRNAELWRELFGQNVLVVPDSEHLVDTIGVTIGLAEGNVTLDAALDFLVASKGQDAADSVQAALANVSFVPAAQVADPDGDTLRI